MSSASRDGQRWLCIERPLRAGRDSVLRDRDEELTYLAPLYLFRQTNLFASGFSGVALGVARSMLEAFKKLSVDKRPRLAKTVLKENTVVQHEVALAEAKLNAARRF